MIRIRRHFGGTISILIKDFKFLQKTGPMSNLISSIDQAMPHVHRDGVEDMCQDTCHILKYSKPEEEYFKSWKEKKHFFYYTVTKTSRHFLQTREMLQL